MEIKARITASRAGPEHHAALTATLASAFQNEPAFKFIIPDPAERARRLRKAFKIFVGEDLRKGQIFSTDKQEAATLWRLPGEIRDSGWDGVRLAIPYLLAFGGGISRGSQVAALITRHLPKEPCWYLHYAGCAPEHQGKGFGGTAIRAGLAAADADGQKTYLETADSVNLPIYMALGFDIISTWRVPDGPEFWGMMRAARIGQASS